MKIALCGFVLLLSPILVRAQSAAEQNYLGVYLEINDAEHCEKQHDFLGASARYQVAAEFLEKLREKSPDWETDLVAKRIQDCREKVKELQNKTSDQVLARMKGTLNSGPDLRSLWANAENSRAEGKTWNALNFYQEYLISLQVIHRADPQWETREVEIKMAEAQKRIDNVARTALDADAELRARQKGDTLQ